MLGTFFDTIIICTMTGLTIVITGSWNVGLDGYAVTERAFGQGLPFPEQVSSFILMVCLVFLHSLQYSVGTITVKDVLSILLKADYIL